MSAPRDPRRFEQYALAVLRAHAAARGGTLLTGNELGQGPFDGLAPEGLLASSGPTYVEVKDRASVRTLLELVDRLTTHVGAGASLLVVARTFAGSPDTLQARINQETDVPVQVMGRRELDRLAEAYAGAASPFGEEFGPAAIESSRSNANAAERVHSLTALRTAFRADRLALFLGAGVSASAGLADWATLLRQLSAELLDQEAPQTLEADQKDALLEYFTEGLPSSPLIVARLLQESFGARFTTSVRKAIYARPGSGSSLLTEIASLCAPGRHRAGPPGVVTFNFDDLLEKELDARELPYVSIFREGQESTPEELPIYHVHGFLPSKARLSQAHEESLVFSEEAYHAQFSDPYSWNNIVQLNYLRSHVCLFVGLSMSDPNLRRLLEITVKKKPATRHYAILKDRWLPLEGLEGTSSDVPSLLRGLEQASLARLGVEVLWVDRYDEIPVLLQQVRRPDV